MSTTFFLYSFKKESMFELFSHIKQFYHEHHISRGWINHYFKKCQTRDEVDDKAMVFKKEWYFRIKEEFGFAELQVFEMDNHWYFRVLESNYFFMKQFEKQGWDITPVFYDDRTDECNATLEALSNELDQLIQRDHYLVYPLVSDDDWNAWLKDNWSKKRRSF